MTIESMTNDQLAEAFKSPPYLLMSSILAFKDDLGLSPSKLRKLAQDLRVNRTDDYIYFWRELKDIVVKMPLRAFQDQDRRGLITDMIQELLDEAIVKEEQELAVQDSSPSDRERI